jgi:hypothetical protein
VGLSPLFVVYQVNERESDTIVPALSDRANKSASRVIRSKFDVPPKIGEPE